MNILRLVISVSILLLLSACSSSSGPPPNDWDNMTWDQADWA